MNSQICHYYSTTEEVKFDSIDVAIRILRLKNAICLYAFKIMIKVIVMIVNAEKPQNKYSHC